MKNTTTAFTIVTLHKNWPSNIVNMISFTTLIISFLVIAGVAVATPVPKATEQTVVTYLGTQGPILCNSSHH
jgi:hypothetical protein